MKSFVAYACPGQEISHAIAIHLKPNSRTSRRAYAKFEWFNEPKDRWKIINIPSTVVSSSVNVEDGETIKEPEETTNAEADVVTDLVTAFKEPEETTDGEDTNFANLLEEIKNIPISLLLEETPKKEITENPVKPASKVIDTELLTLGKTLCRSYREEVSKATKIPSKVLAVSNYNAGVRGWIVAKSHKRRYCALTVGTNVLVIDTKNLFDKGRMSALVRPDFDKKKLFKKDREIPVIATI